MPNRFSLENPKENDPPATIVYKLANLLPGRSINNSDTLQHRWAKKTVTYVRNVTRPPSHIHRPTYPPTHATTAPKKRAKKTTEMAGGRIWTHACFWPPESSALLRWPKRRLRVQYAIYVKNLLFLARRLEFLSKTGCVPHHFQYKEVTFLFPPKNLSQILNNQILNICRVL